MTEIKFTQDENGILTEIKYTHSEKDTSTNESVELSGNVFQFITGAAAIVALIAKTTCFDRVDYVINEVRKKAYEEYEKLS